MAKKEKQEPVKKIYPMVARSEVNNPEVPMAGNLTFLRLCQKYLTPEEIKAAREKGDQSHRESMEQIKKRKNSTQTP